MDDSYIRPKRSSKGIRNKSMDSIITNTKPYIETRRQFQQESDRTTGPQQKRVKINTNKHILTLETQNLSRNNRRKSLPRDKPRFTTQ